jgi:DNA repair exonuclease SbcCD nuclease subunit
MTTKFIHTADWQLGKPFAGIEDSHRRALLQQERVRALERVAKIAREREAQFILVAGDLFDSANATKETVSAACAAIGAMKLPVLAIPGNHDHGGPGTLWEQTFFQREQRQLAPNLQVLLSPEPVELETAVVFPCPLLRRHEAMDTTACLRAIDAGPGKFGDKPRLVLAHGSVQGFGSESESEEDGDSRGANRIDLSRLPENAFDYIALGDWHGTKQAGRNAWYSGTPELDRFPKGEDHQPGNVLVVTASRGALPEVTPVRTAHFGWHEMEFTFADDSSLDQLRERVGELLGLRAQQDLLFLRLSGSLGLAAAARLEQEIEKWQARLLRLKLSDQTAIAPSPAEIEALTAAPDPLISRVATTLMARAAEAGEEAAVARIALRELHALCNRN